MGNAKLAACFNQPPAVQQIEISGGATVINQLRYVFTTWQPIRGQSTKSVAGANLRLFLERFNEAALVGRR